MRSRRRQRGPRRSGAWSQWTQTLALFFVVLALMMLSGMPVELGFLTLNILGLYFFLGGEGALSLLAIRTFSSVGQFALVPIPTFILMGELLMRTGLAAKAVEAVDLWLGRLPGRLSLSVGAILAGGGLAVLIPPSALGVLLGATAKISIAKLLLARFLPGLALAIMYIAYFSLRALWQPALAPAYVAERTSLRTKLLALLGITPLLGLVIVVTGFIFLGIATPPESAAMGVIATLALAACQRRLRFAALRDSLKSTMTTSMMLLVIVGSSGFSQLLAATGATSSLVSAVGELDVPPIVMVILMQLAMVENLQHARLLRKLEPLPGAALGLVETIETTLERGVAAGQCRAGIDAIQLCLSILSLSYLRLSNRHTLSFTYGTDLGEAGWLAEREQHVKAMVRAYVAAPAPAADA